MRLKERKTFAWITKELNETGIAIKSRLVMSVNESFKLLVIIMRTFLGLASAKISYLLFDRAPFKSLI